MNIQILCSVIVSFGHKISIPKHSECLTKQIWCSTQKIRVKLMLSKTKKQALHFYPCKSRKDARDLNKEQGKGKTVCNKAVLTTSAREMGFFCKF